MLNGVPVRGAKVASMSHVLPQPTSPTYAELVADAFLANPELLAQARATCQRWRALEAEPKRWLDHWDTLLKGAQQSEGSMATLQHVLRSADPDSERLREFAPIAGLLPRELRRTARDLCGFRH